MLHFKDVDTLNVAEPIFNTLFRLVEVGRTRLIITMIFIAYLKTFVNQTYIKYTPPFGKLMYYNLGVI